ncbi:hypothetical protein R5R35_012680 [Gryllus longicercus]|uniref:DUF4806 domain-containing protein n=1 Tax=Gryllus longicercus TaxID=2509291 RepID=A0AAN9Z7G4_9ORTH
MGKQSPNFVGTVVNIETFKEKHGLDLPLVNCEDLDKLNNNLNDLDVRQEFFNALLNIYSESGSLSSNLTHVLQKVIDKNFAKKYTCTRQVENKSIFKNTRLYSHLLTFFTNKYASEGRTLTEKDFLHSLKTVLPNAKDWK